MGLLLDIVRRAAGRFDPPTPAPPAEQADLTMRELMERMDCRRIALSAHELSAMVFHRLVEQGMDADHLRQATVVWVGDEHGLPRMYLMWPEARA